jgi:hypothetical protein
MSGDQGKVEVITHIDPPVGKLPGSNYPEAHWISRARFDVTTTTATWVRFSVPFQYYSTTPSEYILVVLTSGDSTQAVVGSQMWIDDLELIYNPNTVQDDKVDNVQINLNPTLPFKGNTKYYINIASGVIIDAVCNLPWGGISDTETATWTTDGVALSEPQALTVGSLYFDFNIDRPITAGYGKLIMRAPDGRLKTTVNIRDLAVKTQDNVPFND